MGLAWIAAQSHAWGASHREAPLIAEDPRADTTDVYAWVTPGTHDKLHIVANWIPLEEPAGGPNFYRFSDDARYEIHISRGDCLEEFLTFTFDFQTTPIERGDPDDPESSPGGGREFFSQLSGQEQTYTVKKRFRTPEELEGCRPGRGREFLLGTGLPVAPPDIGPRTDTLIYGKPYPQVAAEAVQSLSTLGGRVFAGPRDDGFYMDAGGIFDLLGLRPPGAAQDAFAGFNVHTIALEIPTTLLTADGQPPGETPGNDTTLGIWASTSRRTVEITRSNGEKLSFGPYLQVSRLGLPLINEVVIGLQDKDRYNASHPRDDAAEFIDYFLNPVLVRDAEALGLYSLLGLTPDPFRSGRTDILDYLSLNDGFHTFTRFGDVLRVDMATDSAFPNGRMIPGGSSAEQEQTDVTDALLSVILTGGFVTLGDNVDCNDKPFLTDFPYLALPHRGFDEGHGDPCPPASTTPQP